MSFFEIILIPISAFIGGLISAFAVSYFKEKGKNLATKEDVKQITRDIEQIKNEISFEKLRENDYLQERKNKLMSFIPSGIAHKNLIVKMVYAFDRVDDILYIRNLYNCIYEERLKAETIFYECLAFNEDKRIVESLNKFINQISDISVVLIKTIHQLEHLASKRSLILENAKSTDKSLKMIEDINQNLHSEFALYDKQRIGLEDKITKGIQEYSIFIRVLYEINYHQKGKI
ncbi:hypothetical protein D0T53_01060 [Dysgonomonas sp. 216]|uniref:hypothetical protein n=1 Tax=Dysgonomonas sp. 216 TaxID=2302934 RepID=UPI0013D88589|nr:hypothetical protein [Dysgonomonas sp. 216]NDW17502.1 hypothetical protein [Dysgonomonas sp. 216]